MSAEVPKGDAHPINQSGWPDAYPAPKHTTFDQLEPTELASWIQAGDKVPGVDYLVVDVRRADCEYLIPGAINLPAHSFYQSLPSLLPLLSRVPILIFHCGNRNTRGSRCAGWLADALEAHGQLAASSSSSSSGGSSGPEQGQVKVFVLKGGYNGWERDYGTVPIDQRGQRAGDAKSLKAVPL
ncbi:hypothetical protein OC846_004380 [Tilletia horrida]|uniref:Rhodanese domain-containing protein n=1 Tax=Tilletia horrida TaxID=155126 RepID=A0AAN6JQF3_9BASI|nr:hypothetical protein OC845_003923 [Tilletia horrida]KAK0548692.1 hypothetical protein OC846_004380 [Tilletia horrida]KAK0566931.1 hypothetical protein OC861_002974 [Tilletia horrida]